MAKQEAVQASFQRRVPQEWADATIIPIPKKGNLSDCNNWRGIALLDVVGKVVARVIQERLQRPAEQELPESQCGFRKGSSCSDMIFTVRQLMEKATEHRAKQFLLFVDLKKAYDSVPRTALWRALEKLGVPDLVIAIIRSFHHPVLPPSLHSCSCGHVHAYMYMYMSSLHLPSFLSLPPTTNLPSLRGCSSMCQYESYQSSTDPQPHLGEKRYITHD